MRHSITPGNLARRFVGSSDQPLAPEGEALARKTAPLLEPVEHLYRSPMLRCRQTAELLWPGVETTVIGDLRETDFGPLEGMDNTQAKQTELYRRWTRGEIGPGEAVEDSRPRAVRAIRTIGRDAAEQGWRKVAVVAHGGLFMGLLAGRITTGFCPTAAATGSRWRRTLWSCWSPARWARSVRKTGPSFETEGSWMEKELWLPTLSHFQNDNGWSGSSGVLCYEIEKPKEETMTVVLWYGPFCRQYAEEMERRQFPVTEDGIEAMRAWLMERAAVMNAAPERTPADTLAWYQKTAAEKRAEKK